MAGPATGLLKKCAEWRFYDPVVFSRAAGCAAAVLSIVDGISRFGRRVFTGCTIETQSGTLSIIDRRMAMTLDSSHVIAPIGGAGVKWRAMVIPRTGIPTRRRGLICPYGGV
jgi:hypothetical protein